MRLIIEIDGSSHIGKEAYDAYRQKRLEDLGYTIIRFSEGEVIHRYADVYAVILRTVEVLSGERCPPP